MPIRFLIWLTASTGTTGIGSPTRFPRSTGVQVKLRTTRTLKVTEVALSSEERENLAQLYNDPRYEALLDVMERACIELDTAHLNTSVGEPEAILGGHAVAKAAWRFFLYVQKQVVSAYNTRTISAPDTPGPSLEEMLQGVE